MELEREVRQLVIDSVTHGSAIARHAERLDAHGDRIDKVDETTTIHTVALERMTAAVDRVCSRIDNHEKDCQALRGEHITRAEFSPVQRIVYGAAGLILVAVVGALIAQVVQ